MATRHVDYDRIASQYDRRFIAGRPQRKARALLDLARRLNASVALEVGCGTGHWLQELAPAVPALFGLDPSKGMLSQARTKRVPADFVQGYARRLPFRDGTFDLAFCVSALHHFADPRSFVAEALRVIQPEGCLSVMGRSPPTHVDDWYVYRYFEGTYERDVARYPAWETVSEWMAAAGFERTELAEIERITAHRRDRQVLTDPFLQKSACSQLALLTDKAYASGLQRLKQELTRAEESGESLVFQWEVTISMLSGWKP